MNIKIASEKENPLRRRKRYWLSIQHPGKETPNRHDLLPQVAKTLESKQELTVIDKIFSERGGAKSNAKVLVYKDKKDIPAGKMARQERKMKAFLEKQEKLAQEKPAPTEQQAAESDEAKAEAAVDEIEGVEKEQEPAAEEEEAGKGDGSENGEEKENPEKQEDE